ncbi:hypothetical protein B0T14DRAFT_567300 [Immersiella caudata]|uniref:Clr5 domain-containing protein n=1 Tax=Immersiella caudata TaxID=314043 RepID=A0AA40C0I5_9PEZI|nr:hypothetical protein B0T14DRAFT_567300 [Immersiella caudata]
MLASFVLRALMDATALFPRSDGDKFLSFPYEERWECLKHVITSFYLGPNGKNGKRPTIEEVASFMKDKHAFSAQIHQYRHRLRKWDIRKRTLTSEKDGIVSALGKRSSSHATTSDITLDHGKQVDKKQLKRYLKDQARHAQPEPLTPGALLLWNLPYAAYSKAYGARLDEPSPFDTTGATPTYVNIQSPEAHTPGRQTQGPTPTTELINQKLAQDRSNFLLQGRHLELLKSCAKEQRVLLTNYLHDFYINTYVTAKFWGRGPKEWTPGMISVLTLEPFVSPGPSPRGITPGPSPTGFHDAALTDTPTQLCRWSIHVRHENYEPIPDKPHEEEDGLFDISNLSSWKEWNTNDPALSMVQCIEKSLSRGAFSNTPPESLPISLPSISKSLQQHPDQLCVDAVRAAIMTGNRDLVVGILDEACDNHEVVDQIIATYPFHLAAAFLDGGNTCCSMVAALCYAIGPPSSLRSYRDNLGNTVLDAFMVSILRSHSSVAPDHVNSHFDPPHRFPGEDKDICGRWDATSPVLRNHFRKGYARIPSTWKHALCHTAVQAICHSIIAIYGSPISPEINIISGLFIRHCTNCGLKLELGPLHALVVVAFYLAHQGMQGETLFGPLAILVCLLSLGTEPSLVAAISIKDILDRAEPGQCHHQPMTAAELMEAVPSPIIARWTHECQRGWHCILHALRLREIDGREKEPTVGGGMAQADPSDQNHGETGSYTDQKIYNSDFESDGEDFCYLEGSIGLRVHDEYLCLPRGTPILSILWATIQAELLTYRRIEIDQPWISSNFSMVALTAWLEGKAEAFDTPLLTEGLIKPHSECCGWFLTPRFDAPIAEEVCQRQNFVFAIGKTNLTFEPSTLTGAVEGDTLELRFYSRNHSVVQGDLDIRRTPPCTPPTEGIFTSGFFSGFNFPTPPGSVNLGSHRRVLLPERAGSHCKNGMIAVINGQSPAAANQYLANYKAAAAALANGTSVSPASVFGGGIFPLNETSTSTASSSAGNTFKLTVTVTRTSSASSSASTTTIGTSTRTTTTTTSATATSTAGANSFGASFIRLAAAGAAALILV